MSTASRDEAEPGLLRRVGRDKTCLTRHAQHAATSA
jgi:hypothetical protein